MSNLCPLSAYLRLGKVCRSQQPVYTLCCSRGKDLAPKIWALSSIGNWALRFAGLQGSALLQPRSGVWERWRRQCRVWRIVISLVLLRNMSIFFFLSSAGDSFLGKAYCFKQTWGVKGVWLQYIWSLCRWLIIQEKSWNSYVWWSPPLLDWHDDWGQGYVFGQCS